MDHAEEVKDGAFLAEFSDKTETHVVRKHLESNVCLTWEFLRRCINDLVKGKIQFKENDT